MWIFLKARVLCAEDFPVPGNMEHLKKDFLTENEKKYIFLKKKKNSRI